ncbi:MAG: hypothetical protein WCK37_04710 [Candidatus Falkowbacteria bacterium]
MKKFIRSYFLFFSNFPILVNFLLLFFTTLGIAFCSRGENHEPEFMDIIKNPIMIYVLIFASVNIIAIYVVKNRYITTNNDSLSCDDYTGLVTKDGQKIIVKHEPVWAKGKEYSLKRLHWTLNNNNGVLFVILTSIIGECENARAEIPARIEIILNSELDWLEVFEILLEKYKDRDYLSIEAYLIEIFQEHNASNQEEINRLTEEYSKQVISTIDFLNKIIALTGFPKKIISNTINTRITLDDPVFSANKEIGV